MTTGFTAPASLPPSGLAGLDPAWSRLVTTPNLDGVGRTWHILDNQIERPSLTLLCVHGNPSWSYLWRRVIASAPVGVRVIAVDQLNMGFSERTGVVRRMQQRIDDLAALTDALDIDGPVVTLAHDWGGPISLGWAIRHVDQLAGVILTNTAVHQPAGSPAPTLIRMARVPGLLRQITVRTSVFLDGALALTRRRIPADVRAGFKAPYATADRREAIGDFVADIPLDPTHPSSDALERVAAGLHQLADTPVMMVWGPSDPVFADRYLHDLHGRLPHADIHRYEGASHFVSEDADVAGAVHRWIAALGAEEPVIGAPTSDRPVWAAIDSRAEDADVAVIEMQPGGGERHISFAELHGDIARIGAGLIEFGVRPGDRIGLLVPPGLDLTAVLYASWRIGAVVVVVDAGLGPRGIGRALKSAAPDVLVGIPKAMAAARAMRWPGRRIVTGDVAPAMARAVGAVTLDGIRRLGEGRDLPAAPGADAPAAIAFTSGSTGPAKGVAYRHHQLQAQRDALMQVYTITPDDRLVAAFAPFALYGPAMGIPSVVPEMDATSPGTLTAAALGDAVAAVEASLVFASPAALSNVVATQSGLTSRHRAALDNVRVVLSAGAPIAPVLLRAVADVMPHAEPHTPYGMTEVLPVADTTLAEIDATTDGDGVCVGRPLSTVEVTILPIDAMGHPADDATVEPGIVGEVCIRAPHMKDGYDKLWDTEAASSQPAGWHRSGDVGHLDAQGRLWIEGRMAHLIITADGPVTPVGIEHAAEGVSRVRQAAAIGVGPRGTQQVVVVVATTDPVRRSRLAEDDLADEVRRAVSVDVAAVLVVPELPTDKRHNSKIERARIAVWAERVLAGGSFGRL